MRLGMDCLFYGWALSVVWECDAHSALPRGRARVRFGGIYACQV
jgi:G:T-mismatch repair DNA endonuclease (very short patch repair protein)